MRNRLCHDWIVVVVVGGWGGGGGGWRGAGNLLSVHCRLRHDWIGEASTGFFSNDVHRSCEEVTCTETAGTKRTFSCSLHQSPAHHTAEISQRQISGVLISIKKQQEQQSSLGIVDYAQKVNVPPPSPSPLQPPP